MNKQEGKPTTDPTRSRRGDQCEALKNDIRGFPRPRQHNLNSTASREERSAYISEVLDW